MEVRYKQETFLAQIGHRRKKPFLQHFPSFIFTERSDGVESTLTNPVPETHVAIPDKVRLLMIWRIGCFVCRLVWNMKMKLFQMYNRHCNILHNWR